MTGGFVTVPTVGLSASQTLVFADAYMIWPACLGVARSVTLPPLAPITYRFGNSSLATARVTPFDPCAVVRTQKST
jgi:hypothetical protein